MLGVAGSTWSAAAAGRAAGLFPRFLELLNGLKEGLDGVLARCCSVLGGWGRQRDNILLLLCRWLPGDQECGERADVVQLAET